MNRESHVAVGQPHPSRPARRPGLSALALAAWVALTIIAGLPARAVAQSKATYTADRNRLVDEDIIGGGVKNPRVIAAARNTPRHEFVPTNLRSQAYFDMALPIGEGQTISPPFIVAYMTEQLDPQPTDKVLEIGTGSGYQAAILSGLVKEVYTIEIVAPLGKRAAETLRRLNYSNVFCKVGDGFQGWAEHAPFDKVIVTCSPEQVPKPLVEQLKEGGRMIIPVGERYQQTLVLMRKEKGQMVKEALRPTLFVPMTGKAEENRKVLPDPSRPELRNGDFEELTTDTPPRATGWHYQRLMEINTEGTIPSGKRYVTFRNTLPGRPAQALQGFGVDGRKVKAIELTFEVQGKQLRPAVQGGPFPHIGITFFDEKRNNVGEAVIGAWRDSFNWQHETKRIPVPARAREAIFSLGLLDGLGEISFDNIRLRAAK